MLEVFDIICESVGQQQTQHHQQHSITQHCYHHRHHNINNIPLLDVSITTTDHNRLIATSANVVTIHTINLHSFLMSWRWSTGRRQTQH